jgi:hypothetical protein
VKKRENFSKKCHQLFKNFVFVCVVQKLPSFLHTTREMMKRLKVNAENDNTYLKYFVAVSIIDSILVHTKKVS